MLKDYIMLKWQTSANKSWVTGNLWAIKVEIEVLMVNKPLCNIGNVTGILKSWNMSVWVVLL